MVSVRNEFSLLLSVLLASQRLAIMIRSWKSGAQTRNYTKTHNVASLTSSIS